MSLQHAVTARAKMLGLSEASLRKSTVIKMVSPAALGPTLNTTYLSVYDTSKNAYRYQFSKKYHASL